MIKHPTSSLFSQTVSTIACLGLLLVGLSLAAASPAEGASCDRKGYVTLLDNGVARVSQPPSNERPYGRFEGCAYAADVGVPLDGPIDAVFAYPLPAIALSGTVVGYAVDNCMEYCETQVLAEDLDPANFVIDGLLRRAIAAPPGWAKKARVGSLAVRRVGDTAALAWIACPQRGNPAGTVEENGTPRPNCVRAGDKDVVMRLASNETRPVVLARGRDIEPRSLRRKGKDITWRQGGIRRRVPLP